MSINFKITYLLEKKFMVFFLILNVVKLMLNVYRERIRNTSYCTKYYHQNDFFMHNLRVQYKKNKFYIMVRH